MCEWEGSGVRRVKDLLMPVSLNYLFLCKILSYSIDSFSDMGSRCAPDIAKAFLLTKIVIFFLCEKSCLQLNEIKRTFLFLFKAFSISSPSIEHLNKISNISDLFFPTIKLGLCCLDMKLWTILAKNFC